MVVTGRWARDSAYLLYPQLCSELGGKAGVKCKRAGWVVTSVRS